MKGKKIAWFKAELNKLRLEQSVDIRDSDERILNRAVKIDAMELIIDKDEMEVAK